MPGYLLMAAGILTLATLPMPTALVGALGMVFGVLLLAYANNDEKRFIAGPALAATGFAVLAVRIVLMSNA